MPPRHFWAPHKARGQSAVGEWSLGEGQGFLCSSEPVGVWCGAWALFSRRHIGAVWEASLGLLMDICCINSKASVITWKRGIFTVPEGINISPFKCQSPS